MPIDDLESPTLKHASARAGALWPEKTALHFDETGESLTFAEIERRSSRIANVLHARGLGPGDKVAVMLPNVPAFPLCWLAIAKIGAAMVPMNVYYRTEDARHVLADSGARCVITAGRFRPLFAALDRTDLRLEHVLTIDEASDDFAGEEAAAPDAPPPIAVLPEHTANIQYTSGTTGKPKGCVLSHYAWISGMTVLVEEAPKFHHDDTLLTAQPFYYADPQWNLIVAMLTGARLVVLDRFHPSTFWQKVRHYDVTVFYCLGVMPQLLFKTPVDPEERRHKLRMVLCSAIPTNLHQRIEERWAVPWYEVYGMNEIGLAVLERVEEHAGLVGQGCIGRPVGNREIRLVDAEGGLVPRGAVGEIVVRGAGLMDEYFNNPEATAEAFRDGWFHTGDLARMDDRGLLYFAGRLKDMIRRSGENIAAQEVEAVIMTHPAVALAACVAVADDIRGEEVMAFVVPKPDVGADAVEPESLAAYCDDRLAYFKVPRYWAIRDRLPLTPSERVAKGELSSASEDALAGTYDRVEKRWREAREDLQ